MLCVVELIGVAGTRAFFVERLAIFPLLFPLPLAEQPGMCLFFLMDSKFSCQMPNGGEENRSCYIRGITEIYCMNTKKII